MPSPGKATIRYDCFDIQTLPHVHYTQRSLEWTRDAAGLDAYSLGSYHPAAEGFAQRTTKTQRRPLQNRRHTDAIRAENHIAYRNRFVSVAVLYRLVTG